MAEKNLNELFLDTLKDVYYAENAGPGGLAEDGKGNALRQISVGL